MSSTKSLLRQIRAQSTKSVQSTVKLNIPGDSTIFSAIQPTGHFHIGNYLGAVRVWNDLALQAPESTKIYYAVADLHALTVPKEPQVLKNYRIQAIASILATGIDPDRCVVYHQSNVAEHSELSWILTCLTGMSYLNRMTQWKSKGNIDESQSLSNVNEEALSKLTAGIFNYPALQAADILLFKSTHVPVGDDQSQHLELCRHIAGQFNKHYGGEGVTESGYFQLPTTIIAPTKKILSLRNPSKKMSKSDPDEKAAIYVNESPGTIRFKISKSITDSVQGNINFDPVERPGVSNLINIVSGISRRSIEDVVKDMDWIKNHKQFKEYVSDVIIEEFTKPRELYDKLISEPAYLEEISQKGAMKAREVAHKNMVEIKKLVGLL